MESKKNGLLIIFLVIFTLNVFGAETIDVLVNGESFRGKIDGDVIFLPLEDVCSKFDIKYGYFPDTGIIAINYNNSMMSTVINQKELLINSNYRELEQAPVIMNKRVFFPAKFFSEYMDFEVSWKPADFEKTALIDELIIKDNQDGFSIFVLGDKSFSKNEYAISKNEKEVLLSFPDTKIDMRAQDIKESLFIQNIEIKNLEGNIASIHITFTGDYNIQTGPAVNPAGLVIKVSDPELIEEEYDVLPENIIKENNETEENILLSEETSELSFDTSLIESQINTSEVSVTLQDTDSVDLFSEDTSEEFIVEESFMDDIEDIIIEQELLDEDTKENFLEERKIVIDPGHGGNDKGVTMFGVYEKDIDLDVSKMVFEQLLENNAKPYITRTGNSDIKFEDRIYVANKNKAELFISIHCGSSRNENTSGFSIFYFDDNSVDSENILSEGKEVSNDKKPQEVLMELKKLSFIESSRRFTKILSKYFTEDLSMPERMIHSGNIRILSELNCPAVLIEITTLSNRQSADLIKDEMVKKKIADTIVKAIHGFFKNKEGK